MKFKITIAAILAASAASAQAEIGLRADVHAGWDQVTVKGDAQVGNQGASAKERDSGVVYGGEIGYDYNLGVASVGLYAGIQGASTKECSEVYAEVETCAEAGRNITLGARAGVNVTPSTLLYVKGGYSNGQLRMKFIDHVDSAKSFGVNEDMDGYHLGAGAQMTFLSGLYAKLEYVRTDYSDYKITSGSATLKGGIDRDNVIFAVGMRF
jgi:outer membrane immunogenic protein